VFAREPNGGLIALNSVAASIHHKLITDLAARLRLPAIYPYRFFVADGFIAVGACLFDTPGRRKSAFVVA
jgi:putative tryptophan/tyrosine transport system substrate-binding protein